jgi:phage tail sheath gpL-like
MPVSSSSLAAGTSVKVRNESFEIIAEALPRKLLVLCQQLDGKDNPVNTPVLVTSPEDVAEKCGDGGMAHRLALAVFAGTGYGVPVYIMVEAAPENAVAAAETVRLDVSEEHGDGVISLYVAGKKYEIPVSADDTADTVGAAAVSVLSADTAIPGTITYGDGIFTLTAKDRGVWGNGITFEVNQRPAEGEKLPDGVTLLKTGGQTGSGVPDVAADLAAGLGTGDSANGAHFTDIVHGYGRTESVLRALSVYNGEAQNDTGLYSEMVARPFRSLYGNTEKGTEGLTGLITFCDARVNDRCNGVICRPGSLTHPQEMAAEAVGYMAATNMTSPESSYVGYILQTVDSGVIARQEGADWTVNYANRDLAVKSGISPTVVDGGAVTCQNIVSHWRPSNIPQKSNAYREMCNISKIQNILWNTSNVFNSARWRAFTVVSSVANITDSSARSRARDIGMVKDDLVALVGSFTGLGWLYDGAFSLAALRNPDTVRVRPGGDGFVIRVPYILSGVGNIIDNTVLLDTRITAEA